jgi:transposase InsO family protein
LQDKSETQGSLKRFLRRAQNEFELKVKKIRSDNGSEFKNLQVEEFLEEEGIKHEFSAPYTPQQNGVVERKNSVTPILEGKPNANHVRARISNSRTQQLHNWTSSHSAQLIV